MPAKNARRGRRPGDNVTREAILASARRQFAAHGIDAVSMRAVARDAEVDPALVAHFYGSKEELFLAATAWPFAAATAVERIVPGPKAQLGRRIVEFFLWIWEEPAQREPIMALLRAATTSPFAGRLLREALERQVLGPVAARLDGLDEDERRLRMSLCSSQLLGLGVARYIIALEPLASLAPEQVVDHVAPTLQRYLTAKR